VTVRGSSLLFAHPLLRAAAYQAQTVAERRAAHAALAAASQDVRAAAWHLAQAATGPDRHVADALEDAARDALGRGGRAEAVRTFARAAELTPDPALAASRRLAAAAAAHEAGDPDRSRALLEAAEAGPLGDEERGEARRLRALLAIRAGDTETGVVLLEQEAERLRETAPAEAGRTLLMSGSGHMHNGDFIAMLDVAERAAALVGDADPAAAAFARDVAALARAALGRLDDATREDLAAAGGRDIMSGIGEVAIAAAEGLVVHEEGERARELLDAHVDHARREGAVLMLLYALAVRSRLNHRTGRWGSARADAEEAVELQRGVAEDTIFTPYVQAVGAIARMDAGELGEASRLVTASLASATRSGAQTLLVWVHWARGRLALLEGRLADAVEALGEVERVAARLQWGSPMLAEPRADLGDALLATGDRDGVRPLAARLRAEAVPGLHLPLAIAARLEAVIAADDAFEEPFTAALAEHEPAGVPFERARTLLALGARRRRARGGGDAKGPMQEALDAFARMGATPWAARARDELRLGGAPRSAVVSGDPAAVLTGQEWRVAELVVQGMTNREVGAALFLSPKTIEHHLSAIYRKLGVRSRTELAGALGAGVATAS
jgi:DNA-binding CsgD family transcriptional regulator